MAPIPEADKRMLEAAKRAFSMYPVPEGVDVNAVTREKFSGGDGTQGRPVSRPMLDAYIRHNYTNYGAVMEQFQVEKHKMYKRFRRWVSQAIAIYVEYWFYQPGGHGWNNYRLINKGKDVWRNNLRPGDPNQAKGSQVPISRLIERDIHETL